jgi:hypothetical protein
MTLTGPTPILDAVYRGDAAGLVRLVAAGGRLAHGAADAPTHDGGTALAIAEESGHAAIARRLRGELP